MERAGEALCTSQSWSWSWSWGLGWGVIESSSENDPLATFNKHMFTEHEIAEFLTLQVVEITRFKKLILEGFIEH